MATKKAAGARGAPSFIQKPAIKQVEGGKRILFECKIAADPQPVCTWFRDDIQLSEGGRYAYILKEEAKGQYYIALQLSDPQAVDGATYRLHTKNQHGESNANLKLNFDALKQKIKVSQVKGSAPQFTAKPVIRQVPNGVVFEVRLLCYPAPSIQWYHGDKAINQGGRYNIYTQTDGLNFTLILEISGISAEDGGTYKVNAKNQHGESNANLSLNLQGAAAPPAGGKPPSFVDKPSIVMVGNTIIMSTTVMADPMPSIVWTKGTETLKSGGRLEIAIERMVVEHTYKLTVYIKGPTKADSGTYKCTVKNDFGALAANMNLNLEAAMQQKLTLAKPDFKQAPSVQMMSGGKQAVIRMFVTSLIRPQMQMMYGGKALSFGGGSRYNVEYVPEGNGYHVIWTMNEVTKSDGGAYQCVIKNEAGEIKQDVTIPLEGKDEKKDKKKDEKKDEKKKAEDKKAEEKKKAAEEKAAADK